MPASGGMKMKRSWPELVGKPYAEAEAVIKREDPDLNVRKVKSGSMVTMDYREVRMSCVS